MRRGGCTNRANGEGKGGVGGGVRQENGKVRRRWGGQQGAISLRTSRSVRTRRGEGDCKFEHLGEKNGKKGA